MNNKNYKTSYYTTVNVNLRLHPNLSPKEKILCMEIMACQQFSDEQEPTDECLSALTSIAIQEIPALIESLTNKDLITPTIEGGQRVFLLKESLCQ